MLHVLAYAVKEIFIEAKLAAGTVTEDQFFYDFELPRPLVSEDLIQIEEKNPGNH